MADAERDASGEGADSEREFSAEGARAERLASVRGAGTERETSTETAPYGLAPAGATHWQVKRQTQTGWIRCERGDAEVAVSEWPLAELSLATIRRSWGPGTYRITWMASAPKRRPVGTGRPFTLKPPPPPPPPPPAPPRAAPAAPLAAPAPGIGSLLPALGGASPQGLVGAMALLGGGGELGPLAQALMLLQVLDGMATNRAAADIERARIAMERDREVMRERAQEQATFFRELSAGQARTAAASATARANSDMKAVIDEMHERLDDIEVPDGNGGSQKGLMALLSSLPQLLPLLQQMQVAK